MTGVFRSGKMSIGIRRTARTAPSTTPTMPTIIVIGCRIAKIIGFMARSQKKVLVRQDRRRSCLIYYPSPLVDRKPEEWLKGLYTERPGFPRRQRPNACLGSKREPRTRTLGTDAPEQARVMESAWVLGDGQTAVAPSLRLHCN